MQRKHIKRGEIVAYRRGERDTLSLAVVIDTESLWAERRGFAGAADSYRRAEGWRCSNDQFYRRSVGYLCVRSQLDYADNVLEAERELMREFVAGLPKQLDAETVEQLNVNMPKGLYLTVENNRNLAGPWAAVKAEEEAKRARRAASRERERAEKQRQRAFMERINEALTERGIKLGAYRDYSRPDRASIRVADLAVLLGVEEEPEA